MARRCFVTVPIDVYMDIITNLRVSDEEFADWAECGILPAGSYGLESVRRHMKARRLTQKLMKQTNRLSQPAADAAPVVVEVPSWPPWAPVLSPMTVAATVN